MGIATLGRLLCAGLGISRGQPGKSTRNSENSLTPILETINQSHWNYDNSCDLFWVWIDVHVWTTGCAEVTSSCRSWFGCRIFINCDLFAVLEVDILNWECVNPYYTVDDEYSGIFLDPYLFFEDSVRHKRRSSHLLAVHAMTYEIHRRIRFHREIVCSTKTRAFMSLGGIWHDR
jgi:hypothetical protein